MRIWFELEDLAVMQVGTQDGQVPETLYIRRMGKSVQWLIT